MINSLKGFYVVARSCVQSLYILQTISIPVDNIAKTSLDSSVEHNVTLLQCHVFTASTRARVCVDMRLNGSLVGSLNTHPFMTTGYQLRVIMIMVVCVNDYFRFRSNCNVQLYYLTFVVVFLSLSLFKLSGHYRFSGS